MSLMLSAAAAAAAASAIQSPDFTDDDEAVPIFISPAPAGAATLMQRARPEIKARNQTS